MNKLKGKLCTFCMILSAIVTYVDASYKTDFLKQAGAIATDYQQWQESMVNGEHKFVGADESETAENINVYCGDLKYTPEEVEALKQDAYGETEDEEIHKALTTGIESSALGQSIIPSILEASLRGDLEIPYWENKDDPTKPFDVTDDPDIDTNLTEGIVQLSDLVDFAHSLRTVGYTPIEFLELYSGECEGGIAGASHRCDGTCSVDTQAKEAMKKKLERYKDRFYNFVNVIRSIGNEHTYKRMRKDLLYGDAKEKTPAAGDISTAGNADLFNFLHLFLQQAAALTPAPTAGSEENIAQVAYSWLNFEINFNVCYPKVVNTLLDMMYIAHVGAANTDVNKSINQVKRHILSQQALKMLNQALANIEDSINKYRLIGVNDLRIEKDSKEVLELTNAISDDATSFLLPVAFLQSTSETMLASYIGAPLLMASDIVYMVKNKALPIVSMFMCEDAPISTYRTGYNLMKQSIVIGNVTHDGSYNGAGVAAKYGKVANEAYSKDDWGLDGDKTIAIEDVQASLIVGELFSWYTAELDMTGVGSGMFGDALNNRNKYEETFAKKTKDVPSAHAFIVHNSGEVKKISDDAEVAYTPNIVYENNNGAYKDKHYIKLNGEKVEAKEMEIKGATLVASLLNSSWGETMLRASDAELNKFKNITDDSEIDKIGKAKEFNKSGKNTNRIPNHSSTVHQLDQFRKALQVISNYTFPGFQPRGNAYGRPLATLGEKGKETTCTFIIETVDAKTVDNIELQGSSPLQTALGAL